MFDEDPPDTGVFLKLEANKPVTGVLQGKIRTFFAKWDANKKKTECDKDDPEARFRFVANFAVIDGDDFVMKLLEGGKQIYMAAKELEESGYNLTETPLLLKRTGSGQYDTEYTVLPDPKVKFENISIAIKMLALHDLERSNNEKEGGQ